MDSKVLGEVEDGIKEQMIGSTLLGAWALCKFALHQRGAQDHLELQLSQDGNLFLICWRFIPVLLSSSFLSSLFVCFLGFDCFGGLACCFSSQ
jgi:hypothetical protein